MGIVPIDQLLNLGLSEIDEINNLGFVVRVDHILNKFEKKNTKKNKIKRNTWAG